MSAFILKIIAMVSMVCDHAAGALYLPQPFLWDAGRLAFPLYALMLVDSYRHLKEHPERLKKYVVTLAALSVVSEFAYDLAFAGTWVTFIGQNQILQFLTFVLAAILAERIPKRFLKVLFWIAVMLGNQFCRMGYYALGIVAMLLFWWYLEHFEEWSLGKRFPGAAAVMGIYWIGCEAQELIMYPDPAVRNGTIYWNAVFSGLASYAVVLLLIPVIALYNGQYGNPPKWFKVVYRYFYPAHLFILALIAFLMRR